MRIIMTTITAMLTMLPITTLEQTAQRISTLRAVFRKRESGTVLASKYHTAPIKIAKSFPLGERQNGQLGVIVMDVSPGLLAGDRYELIWEIEEGARVYATNQSFTKVHPADASGNGASMLQRFELGSGAVMESMPEPIMLYRGAALANDTEVRLAAGAVWMGAEVLCPGRTLRGERFAYRSLLNRLAVYYGDELIFAQNQRIQPDVQALSAPGCMGDMTHTGVFYAFSDRIGKQDAAAVLAALQALPSRDGHRVTWGVTLTHKHGLAVMASGTAAWPLQETLSAAWTALRMNMLGLPPLKLTNG